MSRFVLPAVLGALCLPFACSEPEPTGPPVAVREIFSELTFQPERWEVLSGDAELGRIVPSMELGKEKEDLPSITMEPSSALRIDLSDVPADARLLGQVAIDRSAGPAVRMNRMSTVEFVVELDGEVAWSGELQLASASAEGAGWLPIGDADLGLVLQGADELVLRTRFVGEEPPLKGPYKVGFGRMQIVQDFTMHLEAASPERPNVVVVVMDTLRIDRTSSGDYDKETTPRLAAFAAEGVDYMGSYATSSWTWPSTASMLTGLLPEEHGVTGTGSSYLAAELDTLAEVMQRAGLATGAFVGNPLIVPSQNFDQGFQTFHGTTAGHFVDGPDLVPGALEWLRANKDQRFFLYLHMVDPHDPYEPAEEVVGTFGMERPETWDHAELSKIGARMMRGNAFDARGRSVYKNWLSEEHQEYMQVAYDEVVWTGDKWFGLLLDELSALGLEENTVVVFTSDHGEELLDHGLVKHTHSLYPELLRVPLVLRGPGIPAGVRVTTPVSNRVLYDTLAAIVHEDDGAADVRLDRPATVPDEPVFFSTTMGFWNGVNQTTEYGVRTGDWELHFAPDGGPWRLTKEERLLTDDLVGKLRLFHVPSDPTHMEDLATVEPERALELLRLIQERLEESSKRALDATLASGEGTVDMLKAIGYLDGAD